MRHLMAGMKLCPREHHAVIHRDERVTALASDQSSLTRTHSRPEAKQAAAGRCTIRRSAQPEPGPGGRAIGWVFGTFGGARRRGDEAMMGACLVRSRRPRRGRLVIRVHMSSSFASPMLVRFTSAR
jgi:hypothetical protein